MSFGSRVDAARRAYGPLCVGLDPHPQILAAWGLDDSVGGLQQFVDTCVEAFAGHIGFIKPQSAFFERFGSRGIRILEDTVAALRHTGSLVILDVKRSDIGSTAAAYAQAYLDEDAPLACDAITVSPYLGLGALEPFFSEAEKSDAGVFVLALTSNPEGRALQSAVIDDESVAGSLLSQLRHRNGDADPMGAAGAVVGATIGSTSENLDINGPLLVPGFGAQGGTVEDVRRLFGQCSGSTIVSASRSILQAGPSSTDLREVTEKLIDTLVDL